MSKAIGTRLGDEKGLVREYMLESSSYQTLIETETSLRLGDPDMEDCLQFSTSANLFPSGEERSQPISS